ncbi:diaminopimelate epimerase [Thermasporomyces composti]|jgi:diaminopimelate epimerase|uniref:Diaminopimelate epimerase n=1 Tax=Thermasporomyces composti TaxID=696763 RepID=A0A3D9VA77_THECX|nr:diaminopimelate epimerase [Thermasporomyces composti]REF35054.1 diaminopimelate epimerase [Thermasporomyces composti]
MGTISWVKGHGTENDFVLLHDPDGTMRLDEGLVRELCHRRRGVGADGVLRVVRSAALDDGRPYADEAEWFMDFRNADGSTGEMCGNGVRVFAHYLRVHGLVDPSVELPVGTRAGVKRVRFEDDSQLSVDMGRPRLPGPSAVMVSAAGRSWPAVPVDMGNPHAVAFVDDLADPGPLVEQPTWSPSEAFPKGVNIEFAVWRGSRHLAMRVHERGVGETRSCGTGACSVAVVAAAVDHLADQQVNLPAGEAYRIDVPGGSLTVSFRADQHVVLTGPAVLTARGEIDL